MRSPFLEKIFHASVLNQKSIALWRLPSASTSHFIISSHTQTVEPPIELQRHEKGFWLHPFEKDKNAFFTPAELHYDSTQTEDIFLEILYQKMPEVWASYQDSEVYSLYYTYPIQAEATQENDFLALVEQGIQYIQEGDLLKVVLSRTKKWDLPQDFHPICAFVRLCAQYPNAYIALHSTPQTGTWICATPEILLSVDKNKLFRTISLAGTQAKSHITSLKEAQWTQKEIEEQALVSRYIVNCFKKIRLREFEETGPRTVEAGNLIHLRTDFTVDMQAVDFPQLHNQMLHLLHPTSAICGMPYDKALAFILEHEGYDRTFYSGFLGTTGFDDEIHLFVNLRSMQLFEKEAILYAGAGITQSSNPQKEWNETEMKCNTLLSVIMT